MFITSIYIRNFRGFEKRDFEFKSNFSVAIGNNGMGKSTLLNAIQVGLGAFLQSMPTLPANYLYRRQFRPSERFIRFDPIEKSYVQNKDLPTIAVYADSTLNVKNTLELPLFWVRRYLASNSTTHNKRDSGQIAAFANYLFENHRTSPEVLYPVFANFEINRTNAQVGKMDSSWRRLSRLEKGYYSALDD